MRPAVIGTVDDMWFERDTAAALLLAKKIEGNSTSACVCIGEPVELNVETLTLADVEHAATLVNPAMMQTTWTVGDAGAAATDNCSSNMPDWVANVAITVTFDGLRLKHWGGVVELASNAANLRPMIEMVLMGADEKNAAAAKDTVAVTFTAPARRLDKFIRAPIPAT